MYREPLFASEVDLDCYSDLVRFILCFCTESHIEKHDASAKSQERYVPDEDRLNKPEVRETLDNYRSDTLFYSFRKGEDNPEKRLFDAQLNTMWLGVAMMEASANISDDDLDHVRSVTITYGPPCVFDTAKEPGKFAHGMYNTDQAQIVTAVNFYRAGTPRSFHEDWSVAFLSF